MNYEFYEYEYEHLGREEAFYSSVSIARFIYYVDLFALPANFLMR